MIALAIAVALQVGSKQFTESVILAEIAVQTLRAAGIEAEHRQELAYRALRSGGIAATDLYSTDAEIQAGDLVVLIDDRGAFPRYDAVLLQRADVPEAAGRALSRLEGTISAREMAAMNARALLD